MSETLKIELGEKSQDNQAGNFFNAIDQVASYYQANSNLSPAVMAKTLELYIYQLTEDDGN